MSDHETRDRYALITAAYERGRNESDATLRATVERVQAENAALREALTVMVDSTQEWVDAAREDSSWDGWDHHYKWMAQTGLPKARAALDPQ